MSHQSGAGEIEVLVQNITDGTRVPTIPYSEKEEGVRTNTAFHDHNPYRVEHLPSRPPPLPSMMRVFGEQGTAVERKGKERTGNLTSVEVSTQLQLGGDLYCAARSGDP